MISNVFVGYRFLCVELKNDPSYCLNICFCNNTRSEIALSWSPMQLKILHRRPEFHSWSPADNWLFQATIIIQTTTLIFSQIYLNLIQSSLPIGQLLFNFPLLLRHKTNFPVVINLPQRFTATICVKLRCHISHNIRIRGGSGNWNEKYCMVVTWCKQNGDTLIVWLILVVKTCDTHQSDETVYMASIWFVHRGFSAGDVSVAGYSEV